MDDDDAVLEIEALEDALNWHSLVEAARRSWEIEESKRAEGLIE